MEYLKIKIKEKKIENYIIILDNHSSQKTEKLIKYYSDNKINLLFKIIIYNN